MKHLTLKLIQKSKKVSDIIYNPGETTLLATARLEGKPTLNGLGMLLYQGVEAFELWTKTAAPIKVMQEQLHLSLGL